MKKSDIIQKARVSNSVHSKELQQKKATSTPLQAEIAKKEVVEIKNVRIISLMKYKSQTTKIIAEIGSLNNLWVKYEPHDKIECGITDDIEESNKNLRLFEESREYLLQAMQEMARNASKVFPIERKQEEATKNTIKATEMPTIENFDFKKLKFWETIFQSQDEYSDKELCTLIESKYNRTTTQALNVIFKSESEGYIIDSGFPLQTHKFKLNTKAIEKCREYSKAA